MPHALTGTGLVKNLFLLIYIGPKYNLTREDLSLGMRRKSSEWAYIVGCHFDAKTEQVKHQSIHTFSYLE